VTEDLEDNGVLRSLEREVAADMGVDVQLAGTHVHDMVAFLDRYWRTGVSETPSAAVDLAWHHFILHTRAYTQFCLSRYGTYLHHEPDLEEPVLGKCCPKVDDGVLVGVG
jgi:hypothetical protein